MFGIITIAEIIIIAIAKIALPLQSIPEIRLNTMIGWVFNNAWGELSKQFAEMFLNYTNP